jgi:competence protein ComEA
VPAPGGEPVNLNTADETVLQSLPGIGPALAKRIVEGRPYATINDLTRVRGIGPVVLNRIRDSVTVGEESPETQTGSNP